MEKTAVKAHVPRLKSGNPAFDLTTLSRCGAKTRSGEPCARNSNIRNGRCKLHGGMSTGPKRDISGKTNPNYRHGMRTKAYLEQEAIFRRLVRGSRKLLREIE